MSRLGALVACVALATATVRAEPAIDESPPTAKYILDTAFYLMFNYPSVRSVRLRIHRDGRSVTQRAFQVAYKKIENRGHTLLRFTDPEYLRDNAILMVEKSGGETDTFLYQSAEHRTRRVSIAQKADAFYGSDLSFEDLEHHDWSRFDLLRLPDGREQGRASYVVEAIPRQESQYSKVVVRVEKERFAILRVDFYRGRAESPVKSLVVAPDEIEDDEGVLKPKRFRMLQHGREAGTEVVFTRIEADPNITDGVFTSMQLERSGTNLYQLVERLSREGRDD